MNLSDEIVGMVSERYGSCSTFDDKARLLCEILALCNERLLEYLETEKSDRNVVISTERVCNEWDVAVMLLAKKRIFFLKLGGFRDYVLHKDGMREILTLLGFKITSIESLN